MKNKYEARLGTERMLPLVFKMALPAVAAQFVNLLYNIVDRIYIGHIPEIGTNALAGIGVTTSIVILISSFSAIVGAGGSPLAAIALGQGDRPGQLGIRHPPVRLQRTEHLSVGRIESDGGNGLHLRLSLADSSLSAPLAAK